MATCKCGEKFTSMLYPICRDCWFRGTKLDNSSRKECCNNCWFFLADQEEYSLGRCRRHSPQTSFAFIDDSSFINWPPVTSVDWCGDWEANDRD